MWPATFVPIFVPTFVWQHWDHREVLWWLICPTKYFERGSWSSDTDSRTFKKGCIHIVYVFCRDKFVSNKFCFHCDYDFPTPQTVHHWLISQLLWGCLEPAPDEELWEEVDQDPVPPYHPQQRGLTRSTSFAWLAYSNQTHPLTPRKQVELALNNLG